MNNRIPLLVLSLGVAISASASSTFPKEFVPGEVLVKAKPGASMLQTMAAAKLGGSIVERIPGLDIARIKIPSTVSVRQAVDYFNRFNWVEFAEPNGIWHAVRTPNDSLWSTQYGPRQIQCEAAWDITIGDSGIIIAIVDTGIQLTHADLSAKLVPGTGFVGNSNGNDDNGHGTHCAGIASATTNNSLGIAGVGWLCSLQPVKVLNSGGSGSWAAVANGIRWAADNGAKVMNISLGGTSDGGATRTAVEYAWNRGTILAAAAGNNGSSGAFYPAFYDQCIAVAATNQSDNRASFSNFGSWVDVAAPGQGINSTWLGGGYTYLDGTSMASPHVAGLAGLIFSILGSGASNQLVRDIIERNTDNIGRYGIRLGRVNAFRAVQDARNNAGRSIFADSITMTRGSSSSGDVNSVRSSDDVYFVINQRPPFLVSDPSAQWTASANTGGGAVNNITLKMELASNGAPTSALRVRTELFNFQTNTWETVDQRDSSTSDTLITVSVGSAGRFVSGGNEIRTRVSWFDSGVLFPNWNTRTDALEWVVQ